VRREIISTYIWSKLSRKKLTDFQALSKKWVDANRRFNGDHWITTETMYGEGNVYSFVSPRQDYADIDKANEVMMKAPTSLARRSWSFSLS